MHTAAAHHRNKRPFQPAITSYFARNDTITTTTTTTTKPPLRESLAPQLPGHVQADLLSVGMRVRKSVPEGYKTAHKTSALPSVQTTLSTPGAQPVQHPNPPRDAVPDEYVHQRELLPFCGLHKIGGFAEQPTTNTHLYAGHDPAGNRSANLFPLPAEAFSQPFSSQDSGYGSDFVRPNPLNPSKRSWQDEDDKALTPNFFFVNPLKGAVDVDEVPVSPLSESPPPRGFHAAPVRRFAQPKSRRPLVARTGSEDSMDTDMSVEDVARRAGPGSDFEEADFLDDNEVAMGGV